MPFPFIDTSAAAASSSQVWEPFREYEWDVETQDFVVRDGQIKIVEGLPALKIWIYKTLLSQRGRYKAYTWNYGNDLDSLIGADLTRDVITSEAKRITDESLYVNKHIFNLKNFTAAMQDNQLTIKFTAETDSGDIEVSL